jgi:hypothetical protein
MSVGESRLAAAQRTAASRRGRTRTRLAAWIVIVPTLTLFSSTVIAGAKTFGKPDYAQAAEQLPRTGAFVLVSSSASHDSWLDRLRASYTSKELCAVTEAQLQEIASRYEVGQMTVTVAGQSVEIATVSGAGANDHELRALLGDPKLKCKLVREGGVFFLPFDPHGS